jgi:hypothetical protein
MKKNRTRKTTRAALFTGAAALMALTPQLHAQSSDALINKLEQKGILSAEEAKELRAESRQDFNNNFTNSFDKAFGKITGMPDWVTGYKLYGDFRGRYDKMSTDNPGTKSLSAQDRDRLRYRLRVGLLVNMTDDMQVGFRLGSGDTGSALSNNQTLQDNGTKKPVWIDAAYGKWTPLHDDPWMLAMTIGKMDQPFQSSYMLFDPDYTPEGAALQTGYKFNAHQSLALNTAAFVLDEMAASSRDPFLYGAQLIWNANWTPKIASSLGVSVFDIVNKEALGLSGGANPPNINAGGVPNNNEGNTRDGYGNLIYNYNPVVVSASATYTLDSFPLYKGKFPIKLSGEYMNNPGAPDHNEGAWAGITFGKSGKRGTWDVSYRYQYLEADAWYDEMVDDDNVVFYSNTTTALAKNSFIGGTNIKGHLIKFNYSITDALTFSLTSYLNELIKPNLNSGVLGEPKNGAIHVMADVMWKF